MFRSYTVVRHVGVDLSVLLSTSELDYEQSTYLS